MHTEISENNPEEQKPESTLKEKTAKGLFWGGISNTLQQVIGMAFGIFIARILNPDDYGLIAMLAIFSAIATTVIDSGFAVALINKKDAGHKDYNAVFWFGILIGLGIYLILFFTAPLIAKFFKQPVLTNLSRVIFAGFLIGSTGVVHYAILLKNMKVKQIGIVNVCGVFVSGAIGLLLALNGFAYWGLAIQQVSLILVSVLLRWYFSPWRPTFRFDFAPLKEMIGFSSKIFAANIVNQINANTFDTLLGKFFDVGLLGNFSQGRKWVGMSSLVVNGALNTVMQPVFVQVNDDKERQLRVFRKMTRFAAFIVLPAFIGLAYIAPEFIRIALGEKWTNSIVFMQLMCCWGIVSPFISLYSYLLISHNKSTAILGGYILICLAQLSVFTIMFLMKAYITQIVLCHVITYCSSLIYWHYHGYRLIGIRRRQVLKDVFPYLITTIGAVALSALALFYVKNIYVLFAGKILLFTGIYLTVLYMLDSKILKETIILLLKRKTIN